MYKFIVSKTLFLILCLHLISLISAQSHDPIIKSSIDDYYQKGLTEGLAVSVVSDQGNFVQFHGENVSEGTPFWLGSVSKTFTALGILRLSDAGKIDLDIPAYEYLPELGSFPTLTTRHLLHHHSGFSQISGYDRSLEFEGRIDDLNVISSPGEKGIYSSTNFILLGMIIEAVSNDSYADFMQTEVFQPLGMKNTRVPTHREARELGGYCLAYGFQWPNEQMKYGKYVIPAGYIVSTLTDVNHYADFLLHNKMIDDQDSMWFLEPATFSDLFAPYNNSSTGFAMSWGVSRKNDVLAYGHEGMTKISNARITVLPEENLVITVLANTNSGPFFSISSQLTNALMTTLTGQNFKAYPYGELIVRIILAFLVLKIFYDLTKALRKWKSMQWRLKWNFQRNKVLSYAFELAPLFVMLILPNIIGVSIDMLLRIMPDLGIALVLGGVSAPILAMAKMVVPSQANENEDQAISVA